MKGSFFAILIFVSLLHLSTEKSPRPQFPTRQTEKMETSTSETDEDSSDEDGDGEMQSNDPNSIAFYLYPDPNNNSYFEELELGNPESLYASHYDPERTPIFLLHGFTNNYTCKFSQQVKNAFLEVGLGAKHNVIVVDWGALSSPQNQTNLGAKPLNDLAKNPFYKKAVKNVPIVGKRLAEFVYFLYTENFLESPMDVYLIGFSLGAQVSGCAGYEVKQNMSMPIGRISGMDPAGPLFKSQTNNALKLDASDAEFVDIVHTNQGQSGYEGNIGDLDFYPNGGGPNQNDCLGSGVDTISGSCAHSRAWVYYIKALSTEVYACKCYATPDPVCKVACQSKILFGYYAPTTARGTYYVDIFVKE